MSRGVRKVSRGGKGFKSVSRGVKGCRKVSKGCLVVSEGCQRVSRGFLGFLVVSSLRLHDGTSLCNSFFFFDTAEDTSSGKRRKAQPHQRSVPLLSLNFASQREVPVCATQHSKVHRAVTQESKDHHRSLQACSTRLRNNGGSERALNRARDLMNVRVSSDHRPPTSPANTTNRHWLLCPESSGYRRSFRCLASLRATPSLRAAPGRTAPSAWRGETSVVSIAT